MYGGAQFGVARERLTLFSAFSTLWNRHFSLLNRLWKYSRRNARKLFKKELRVRVEPWWWCAQ